MERARRLGAVLLEMWSYRRQGREAPWRRARRLGAVLTAIAVAALFYRPLVTPWPAFGDDQQPPFEPAAATPAAPPAGTGEVPDAAPEENAMPISPGAPLTVDLPNGRFYRSGTDGTGYAIVDEPDGAPLWTAYRRLGGRETLGAPISRPFFLPDARVYQATEYALLCWLPGASQADLADTLDLLSAAGLDDWLWAHGVPRLSAARPSGAPDAAAVVAVDRLAWLAEPSIRDAYFALGGEAGETAPPPAAPPASLPRVPDRFGLPASWPEDFGSHVTQRFQRGALRLWRDRSSGAAPDVATAPDVAAVAEALPVVLPVPVGALLRESGLLTTAALAPDHVAGGRLIARAPRPQLAWRSDRGWGIPALSAPPVPGASPAASTSIRGAGAPAPIASPAPGVPGVSDVVGAPATASAPAIATANSGSARPPAALQPGARPVVRPVVNQGRIEYVVLANEGTAPQELTGWALRSASGGQTYRFPPGFVLVPGATVNVHSGAGDPLALQRPPSDLFATRSNIWRNAGDTAQLLDPWGQVVSEFRYGLP